MLVRELDKIDKSFTVSRSILENQTITQYNSILEDFKTNDIKIIFGIFDIATTVKLFCEIFKKKMYGENYQWIILGTYNKELSLVNSSYDIGCTREQLLIALNGTLQTRVVQYSYEYEMRLNSNSKENKNNLKMNAKKSEQSQLEKKYSDLVNLYMEDYIQTFKRQSNANCLYSYFHGYAFDVLLAIFKVFSNLIENKKFSCPNENFQRNITWFNLVNNAFKKMSFKGVTVSYEFNLIAQFIIENKF